MKRGRGGWEGKGLGDCGWKCEGRCEVVEWEGNQR